MNTKFSRIFANIGNILVRRLRENQPKVKQEL